MPHIRVCMEDKTQCCCDRRVSTHMDEDTQPEVSETRSKPAILAYSDTESDDEQPIDEVDDIGNNSNKDLQPANLTGGLDPHQLTALLFSAVQHQVSRLTYRDGLAAAGMLAFWRVLPRALTRCAGRLIDVASCFHLVSVWSGCQLPHRLLGPVSALHRLWQPLLLHRVLAVVGRRRSKRRLSRLVTRSTDGVLERAALEREGSGHGKAAAGPDMDSLASLCNYFAPELLEVKRLLLQRKHSLPVDRWDRSNSELLRFAACAGLFKCKRLEERRMCIAETVARVSTTLQWAAQRKWMTAAELHQWEPLVRWCRPSPSGHTILLVRLGRALQHCKGSMVQRFVTAVLSTVHNGTVSQLRSNKEQKLEQVVVVVDCRGANSLMMTQHIGGLKEVAQALTQHYPSRLHKLFLVEVPGLLRFALAAVMPVLPTSTQQRLRVVALDDKELPVKLAGPNLRRLSTLSTASSGLGSPIAASPSALGHAASLPVGALSSIAGQSYRLRLDSQPSPTASSADSTPPDSPCQHGPQGPVRGGNSHRRGSTTLFTPQLPSVKEPADTSPPATAVPEVGQRLRLASPEMPRCMSAECLPVLQAEAALQALPKATNMSFDDKVVAAVSLPQRRKTTAATVDTPTSPIKLPQRTGGWRIEEAKLLLISCLYLCLMHLYVVPLLPQPPAAAH